MNDDKISVNVITKGEIRSGTFRNFEDPDGIAVMSAARRRALLENPLSNSDSDPAQIIGLSGNRAIGRIDLLPGEIELDGNSVPIVWGSALYVPDKYRETVMGLMLIQRMQTVAPAVGATGVSEVAATLFRGLRWTELRLPRYVLVRRSRRFIAAFLRSEWLARILAPFADIVFASLRFRLHRRMKQVVQKYAVVSLSEMPEQLTLHPLPVPRAMPHRSSKWVNWLLKCRFEDDPSLHKALFIINTCKNDTPLGYVLIKRRNYSRVTQWDIKNVTIASIQDWGTFNPDLLSEIDVLNVSINRISKHDIDAIEICTNEEVLVTALRRWGLIKMNDLKIFYKANTGSLLADPFWKDPRLWWLRPSVGDNFFT